eukprot:11725_1
MPKFTADWNVFDDAKDIKVVQDIQWKNDHTAEQGFIPSDVLNAMDVPFEYGDAVNPPTYSQHAVASDTNIKQMKRDERETDVNGVCDTESKNVDNAVNTENEEICDEAQEERKQTEQMQPLIIEDDAQNKPLQMPNEDVDVEAVESADEDAQMVRLMVDGNALQNAIAKLKPSQRQERENSIGKGDIFEEIAKRRQYYTDTEDEDESSLFQ